MAVRLGQGGGFPLKQLRSSTHVTVNARTDNSETHSQRSKEEPDLLLQLLAVLVRLSRLCSLA